MRLDDPDDLLATGVIVEASPAGKTRQAAEPAVRRGAVPDRAGAAVRDLHRAAEPVLRDGRGGGRARRREPDPPYQAFNELREHAQLIIITHQQRTMSIADALYGITMRSDGVTAVVSQKLSR